MMTLQKEGQEAFLAFLWEQYGAIGEGPLQKIRAKAWDHFQSMGLPGPRDDVYRYVPLRRFFARSFVETQETKRSHADIAPFVLPECRNSVLVFVNGRFSPDLSNLTALPSSVVVQPLDKAMGTYGAFLNSQWTRSVKDEADPFVLINAALHTEGCFIYVAPKTLIETPIQLLNVMDCGDAPMLLMPRVQAFVGARSETTFISTYAQLSGEGLSLNGAVDFSIEEDAHVKFVQDACGFDDAFWGFEAFRAVLKRDSTLKTIQVNQGASALRFDYRVALAGENAEASLNGVWMLLDKRESHTHVLVDHQAPFCRSMQLYKGVLDDISRSSFEGKILVRQAAQKTEAFQLNNNLLLSDRANADSKPNLEIFADDVKASHGSTVGQLDAEQIFYMKTRGFSDAQAKNLLVWGYCQEVIDMVPVASGRERMKHAADNYLLGKSGAEEA